MAIKFSCQHCKKPLSVKDELAGKQGKCPGCKQVILIPQQQNTPPPPAGRSAAAPKASASRSSSNGGVDLEELAAATLSEKPAEQQVETQTVDFTCPWCDAELHLPAELAGKQAPCTNPECKRIVKVPMLKKTGPRDWRKPEQNTMPSGAKRSDEPLEGAWGSQVSAGVSRKALVEAKVIKEEHEPVTVRGWILRGLAAAVVLCLAGAGVLFFLRYQRGSLEQTALQLVQTAAENSSETLPKEDEAWLETGLAEYFLRKDARDSSDRSLAFIHLQKAKAAAAGIPMDSPAKGPVLRELLTLQLDAMQHYSKSLWKELDELDNEFIETLGMTPAGPVREDILRELARRAMQGGGTSSDGIVRLQGLVQRGIKPVTIARATPASNGNQPAALGGTDLDYSDQLNALGVLGQELASAGRSPEAAQIADMARRSYKPDHPAPGQLIGLVLQIQQPELEGLKPTEVVKAGQVAGLLRSERLEDARKILDEDSFKTSTTGVRLATLLDAAGFLAAKGSAEEARQFLQQAQEILDKYPKTELVWERCRFVELDARLNGCQEAEKRARELLEGQGLGLAYLSIARVRSATEAGQLPRPAAYCGDPANVTSVGPVVLFLCRLQARSDPSGTVAWAQNDAPESLRPFAGLGALLGLQDSSK